MKKSIIAFWALCSCMVACNDKPAATAEAGQNSETQKNLQAAHLISKAFENGNTALIDSSVAADFVDHRDVGDVKGIDSLKALILAIHGHMKDMKMDLIKEMADGDYVMQWMHFTGSSDGEANTMKGPFNVRGVEISRFKNGKAVEHWEAMDIQDVSKMMQTSQATDSTTMK